MVKSVCDADCGAVCCGDRGLGVLENQRMSLGKMLDDLIEDKAALAGLEHLLAILPPGTELSFRIAATGIESSDGRVFHEGFTLKALMHVLQHQ